MGRRFVSSLDATHETIVSESSYQVSCSGSSADRIYSRAGRRVFKMSPLHHHYQMLGYAEPKIVQRFMIVGIMLAIFAVITLKLR